MSDKPSYEYIIENPDEYSRDEVAMAKLGIFYLEEIDRLKKKPLPDFNDQIYKAMCEKLGHWEGKEVCRDMYEGLQAFFERNNN